MERGDTTLFPDNEILAVSPCRLAGRWERTRAHGVFRPFVHERRPVKHVRATIEELRRYISTCEAKLELEEVDNLLAIALEEVRRKLAQKQQKDRRGES